ncbi:hypothetical protein L7F22_043912 [Adiantum nelumboides]|nr:hypothetical protein [Adiantum nelumboides]
MPKNIAPRGNPIAMPTIDQPNHTANQNRGPNHTRSNFIQGPQVGRNTLDAPSSSNTSNTKGHAFGGKSLVLNKHRSEGNGRSAKAPRIANPSFGLSSFSAGVPSAGSKIKPLVMHPERTSPSVTTESADLPHHKQYRDASNAARIVHHSLRPTQENSRKMQTRSEAKKPQANDETIVLDDSDDDDRQNNDLPSSSQSPQTHFHQVNGNGKSEEKDESASGSPVESLTTTGDTEMEETRPAIQLEESIESNPKAKSSPNGDTGHHILNDERTESHENTSSLPSALSVLHKKSFVIAQPLDASRSRITDKMKGKDGQTKSMIDTRSTAKAKNHNDKYYSSGLNTRSNFSGNSDRPIKLKLRKIAFDPDGFIGFEASPTVELTSSGESIEICWDEDGSGRNGQTTVINFNDCESLRASKDSSSMYPKPHRYLEITMVEDCDTFNKVKELLEKILGFGAVRGSNRIILDAIQEDSREEHKWVELRKRLSKMRIRPLQGLENNSAGSIDELFKELKPLTSTRGDQDSSISHINNSQITPVPRPKARPSVTNTSNPSASSSSSRFLRTSDVRGTRHNDKDERAYSGRDIAKRRGPQPAQSKSPSPKKVLDPNKKLLSYPFHNLSPGYVTILQSDLDRLDPGEFLNDTMIDFGLKYLLEEIRQRDPELCKEIFVFSSFFYNRLNEKKSDRKVGYELVKKWTRKAELFKKKYIVVPINENLHWYLAILSNPLFAIPQEIRNGKESDKEAIAGSEYNSARSSPTSGVEPSAEEDTTRDNDLFAGNISAQHQQVPEIDEDGDSNMFPVLDRRTDAETYQIYAHSDVISNNGGGTVEGGGGNQKRGNPIEPGQSFPESEDSKRSRTTISSRRHEIQSPAR